MQNETVNEEPRRIKITDKPSTGGRARFNTIWSQEFENFFKFDGSHIPGVVTVISHTKEPVEIKYFDKKKKQHRTSKIFYNVWEVEMNPGDILASRLENFNSRRFFNGKFWDYVINEFFDWFVIYDKVTKKNKHDLDILQDINHLRDDEETKQKVEDFIRVHFPKKAAALDASDLMFEKNQNEYTIELLDLQKKLAASQKELSHQQLLVEKKEELKKTENKIKELKEKTEQLKEQSSDKKVKLDELSNIFENK
jgi:hypothetical protein